MSNETFVARPGVLPDYGVDADWSGGKVPGLGTIAVIEGTTVVVDPLATLSARIVLQNGAALAGNDSGFALGQGSALSVQGADGLFADGALINRGTMVLAGGATLTMVVEAGSAIAQSYGLQVASFANAGQATIFGGATLAVEGTELSNTGAIVVDGGVLEVAGGAVDGGQARQPIGGEIVLEGGGQARFADGVANQRLDFAGAGTAVFADVADVEHVTVQNFSTLDSITVASVAAGETLLERLKFTGLPADMTPTVIATGTGAEILLEEAPPCFARGASLLTPTGYRPVETLRPGDPVVTAHGDVRAVRWVGHRTLDIAAHRRPEAVQPVRITAGAISPGVPVKALRLSPDHALLLHGQLVPVKLLVNGATIWRERGCVAVTYYHVELDRHDVLLAENLPVESYIDTGNRGMFESSAGAPRRSPVFGRGKQWDASAFAPLCLGGPTLREIRGELRARTLAQGYTVRTLTEIALWTESGKLQRVGGGDAAPVFGLAGAGGRVTISSPRFVPAEFSTEGEDAADERLLGVALRAIRLDAAVYPVQRLARSGFHPRGTDDVADWTDGGAEIDVPSGHATIGLDIAALPRGWLNPSGHPI